MQSPRKLFLVLGISQSIAAQFNLYSADGRFVGQVEAESDREIANKTQKNIALYKKGIQVRTVPSKQSPVMEDSVTLNLDTLPEWIELEKKYGDNRSVLDGWILVKTDTTVTKDSAWFGKSVDKFQYFKSSYSSGIGSRQVPVPHSASVFTFFKRISNTAFSR